MKKLEIKVTLLMIFILIVISPVAHAGLIDDVTSGFRDLRDEIIDWVTNKIHGEETQPPITGEQIRKPKPPEPEPTTSVITTSTSTSTSTSTTTSVPIKVLELKFNEGSGQVASDTSGNNNHGQLGSKTFSDSEDPTWILDGKYSKALRFFGGPVGDFVEVPDKASLDPSSITIMMWARAFSDTSASDIVISKRVTGETTGYMLFKANVYKARFEFGNANVAWSYPNLFSLGVWTHIAVTYNGNQVCFYKNATLHGTCITIPEGAIPASNWPLRIGAGNIYSSGEQAPTIDLDEVKIFNKALSGAEIQAEMAETPTTTTSSTSTSTSTISTSTSISTTSTSTSTSISTTSTTTSTSTTIVISGGKIVEFKFNEGSGQTAFDNSGNNNHATLGTTTASEAVDPTWTSGKSGSALWFTGGGTSTHDFIQVLNTAALNPSYLTIMAWMREFSDASTLDTVVSKRVTGDVTGYMLFRAGSKRLMLDFGNNHVFYSSFDAIDTTDWVHIAVTYNGNQVCFYKNGLLHGSCTSASFGPIPGTTRNLRVGGGHSYVSSEQGFSGYLDEVKLFDRALSASEIQAEMNDITTTSTSTSTSTSSSITTTIPTTTTSSTTSTTSISTSTSTTSTSTTTTTTIVVEIPAIFIQTIESLYIPGEIVYII